MYKPDFILQPGELVCLPAQEIYGCRQVACAGVTLRAVSTAIGIDIRSGSIKAEGDLDFRGTLGVSKEVPVGFKAIRLLFDLETNATNEQMESLAKLTERYCVVYQTITSGAAIETSYKNTGF